MTDNVIQFPAKNIANIFPSTIEQSLEHLDEVRKDYCDEVTEDAVEAVFSVFTSYGIHVKPDENAIKYIVFMEEAIKSLLYSVKKLPHGFQEVAQVSITINEDARDEMDRLIGESVD